MAKAVHFLESGEQGDYAGLQWLYRYIEKRDAVLRALKRRLFPAVSALDWNIKIPSTLNGPALAAAEAQQKTLREAYDRIENLRAAFKALVLADFRGFSHLEKHWIKEASGWHIHRLDPVPQWHWIRAGGIYGEWQFSNDASPGKREGLPISSENFIIRQVDDPIDEIALICFVRKGLSQKDWDGFIETYGIPWIFLILPPEARGDDFAKYQEVADQVASDSRGTLPHGTDVKTADAGNRGGNPFKEHIAEQREEIILAGTGGLLTMLAEAGGMGSGVARAHAGVFRKIARELANDISEIFQTQFDKQLLDQHHPDEKHYAYFELAEADKKPIDAHFERAVKAHAAGLQIDNKELSEKTGYTIVDSR